ncbi:Dot/Icm T4SS effector Wip [Legionella shakespearei]|uniref:Substrate of the Dot/Icm secretion system n=2 Tax=Legionella shakespearei TaxID=45075 RepID=A0A0W0YLA9_9GAMM|nr:Dot/Icm T4SS effector Wip [Legionella shakespearei]KTD57690.1 substrate of the Dot/Icm secretion system [Legionella shakespearei DSM 23087]
MVNRVISKTTNIYVYPSEQETHLGSLTLGDLHGNAVKLLHFFFQYQIIQFKKEVTQPEKTYEEFVTLYESYGEILEEYLENSTLLQLERTKITNAKERIENIKTQLSLEENKDSPQYQSLFLLQQQIESRLETSQECKKRLKQLRSEIIKKVPPVLEQLNQFINKIAIKDREVLIRLIGDELADRGHCDYFTLRILDLFSQNHGRLAIIFSNHGYEFISAYEKLAKNLPFVPQKDIVDFQTTSFSGLKLLIKHGFITKNELVHLTNKSYKPALKLIDYTLDETGITLFSHAPMRFDHLELTARFLKVTYDDSTKEALAKTIDEINGQLEHYIHEDITHLLFHSDCIKDKTNMTEEERAMWPLIYLIWNRWDQAKETETARPASNNDYLITYVHGHDPFQSPKPHVHNLDTLCGKDSRKKEDEQINKSFQFLAQNRYTSVDTTGFEQYLRLVHRSKVFDSNGYGLQSDKEDEVLTIESPLDAMVLDSLKKFSMFGKAVQTQSEQPEEKANPSESIL